MERTGRERLEESVAAAVGPPFNTTLERTMAERWEPTLTDTLPSDIRLLSLVDDQEGFRVLLQDPKSNFVYGLYADVVFYRRCELFADFADSPPQVGAGAALLYRVHDSGLITWLKACGMDAMVHEPLTHYALCFKYDERIDIVCRRDAKVRGAHPHNADLVAMA